MVLAQHSVPEPGAQHVLNKHLGTEERGLGKGGGWEKFKVCASPREVGSDVKST